MPEKAPVVSPSPNRHLHLNERPGAARDVLSGRLLGTGGRFTVHAAFLRRKRGHVLLKANRKRYRRGDANFARLWRSLRRFGWCRRPEGMHAGGDQHALGVLFDARDEVRRLRAGPGLVLHASGRLLVAVQILPIALRLLLAQDAVALVVHGEEQLAQLGVGRGLAFAGGKERGER